MGLLRSSLVLVLASCLLAACVAPKRAEPSAPAVIASPKASAAPPLPAKTGCGLETFDLGQEKRSSLSRALLVADATLALEAHVEAELKKACGGLLIALDAPRTDAGGKGSAIDVCQSAIKAVNDLKATLGPKVRLSLDAGHVACALRLEDVRACIATCDKSAMGSNDALLCEEGKTIGRCKGECAGRCNDKTSRAACTGTCLGRCSGAFEDPACEGELKLPPAVTPDCRTACEVNALPRALCPGSKLVFATGDAADPSAARLSRAVTSFAPAILRIGLGIGPRASALSVTTQVANERSYDLVGELAREKSGDGPRLRTCFEGRLTNAANASARLKAAVDVALDLRASFAPPQAVPHR